MRRRDFLSLFGGAVVAAVPLVADAQQASKVYRIAIVSPSTPIARMSETGSAYYRVLFERLRQLGYIEGQNIAVARYSAEGREDHFAELAREVVRAKPDVIFVTSVRLTLDFKAATDTIPVVASAADPVAWGIAPNLARPGGNITGVSVDDGIEIWGKRLELLREMIPAASRVAYLVSRRLWEAQVGAVLREAAQRMKISLLGPPLDAPLQEAEYRRVFAAIEQEGADALMVNDQVENSTNARLIVELAAKARLPAIYPFAEFTGVGGLMAYGVDPLDMARHPADQVELILKGTKPGEIPFYLPTKYELVINLKTAKALGIAVPPSLLIAASEVIE
ncbi:MAG TPA: ABC transporter substrate-binding protein [Stellaceae bacterium]|nr:ABC transporter substrate-binding protein [Stellaceae bacterium]